MAADRQRTRTLDEARDTLSEALLRLLAGAFPIEPSEVPLSIRTELGPGCHAHLISLSCVSRPLCTSAARDVLTLRIFRSYLPTSLYAVSPQSYRCQALRGHRCALVIHPLWIQAVVKKLYMFAVEHDDHLRSGDSYCSKCVARPPCIMKLLLNRFCQSRVS